MKYVFCFFAIALLSLPSNGQIDRQAAFHFNEAILHFKEKNYEAAVQAYDKALKITPEYEKALYNRGKAKLKLKNYKSALADFKKTGMINPKHAKAHLYSGICLMRLKN